MCASVFGLQNQDAKTATTEKPAEAAADAEDEI